MKKLALVLCFLGFLAVCVNARAATDPSILMDDPCGAGAPSATYGGGTVSFTANSSFGGCFLFTNGTGSNITYVDVAFNNNLAGFTAADINCPTTTAGFGSFCTKQFDANGVVELIWQVPICEFECAPGGYATGATISFNLNDPLCDGPCLSPDGSGGWKNLDGSPITLYLAAGGSAVTPNVPVPEPASLVLMGTGIGAVWLRRRRL